MAIYIGKWLKLPVMSMASVAKGIATILFSFKLSFMIGSIIYHIIHCAHLSYNTLIYVQNKSWRVSSPEH